MDASARPRPPNAAWFATVVVAVANNRAAASRIPPIHCRLSHVGDRPLPPVSVLVESRRRLHARNSEACEVFALLNDSYIRYESCSTCRSVDLNLLPVFEAVYEERSLSRAAIRLAMTQSAVSHALVRLRALFRDELFIRQARGVLPTPAAGRLGCEGPGGAPRNARGRHGDARVRSEDVGAQSSSSPSRIRWGR